MFLDLFVYIFLLPALLQDAVPAQEHLQLNADVAVSLGQDMLIPQRVYGNSIDVELEAYNAIVVDADTGSVLYTKNSSEPAGIASITKLMTVLVFLDYQVDLDTWVTLSKNDWVGGGIHHFKIDDSISIEDLIFAALVSSDNEAALALAKSTGVSERSFVEKMNEKARDLGMNDTVFYDVIGLKNNTSTTEDVVRLLINALEKPIVKEATGTITYEAVAKNNEDENARVVSLPASNILLRSSYLDVVGGKTGFTDQAGYCLATKIRLDNGRDVYVVVLGSNSILGRFQDTKALVYWVSQNYIW